MPCVFVLCWIDIVEMIIIAHYQYSHLQFFFTVEVFCYLFMSVFDECAIILTRIIMVHSTAGNIDRWNVVYWQRQVNMNNREPVSPSVTMSQRCQVRITNVEFSIIHFPSPLFMLLQVIKCFNLVCDFLQIFAREKHS